MGLGLVIVIFTCVVNSLLGTFVYLRNSKSKSNLAFLSMSLAITAWATVNYLTNVHMSLVLNNFFDRLAFMFAYLAVLAGWRFSHYYTVVMLRHSKIIDRVIWSLGLLLVGLSATSYVSGSAVYANQRLTFTNGPLVLLYIIGLLATLVLIARNLISAMHRGSRQERLQAKFILFGFATTVLLGIISNVIIPILSSTWQSTYWGPILSLFLVGSITYAIVKHRLFDIRILVARSLAYAFSVATLAGLFIGLTLFFSNVFFRHSTIATIRWVYTILAIVIALFLPTLKRFFDRITNRIFFRDSYDTQHFLDQFNKVLVSSFELNHLLKKCSQTIADSLKTSYCLFGIRETESLPQRIIGTYNHPQFSKRDIDLVRKMTPYIKHKVIVTDLLDDKDEELRQSLQKNNIAIISRLVYSVKEEGIGYLVLGPKKSGDLYSTQDIKVIEIITNELIIAIQNALRTEEIENFNHTLQEKVDSATRKLRGTNQKLRDLDETKDDFISMASHQLRTPLTSVKGYISMVLDEDAGKLNQVQREMLGQAFFSSQRMVYLIADLLNVSRLKTGKFLIEPVKINLADMVQQELKQLEETAASRSLTLQYEKPADFPDLMLDETKIRQVIMNFIDNSIYYTPAGGHVVIRLVNNRYSVEFRVEDDGIGVPKEDQHHLFTKFYRAGNARKARPDGTGLGLFMAKKVVIAQGGSLIFNSQEGKGSTFGFSMHKLKDEAPLIVEPVAPAASTATTVH